MEQDLLKIIRAFILQGIDEDSLIAEVEALKGEFPAHSPYELSDIMIKRTGILSSVSGGITGFVPWPFTMLMAFPDLIMMLILQSRMILKIAILAEKNINEKVRINEVLACMGASVGAVTGTVGLRRLIDTGVVKGILPAILKKILSGYMKSSVSRFIPFMGSIAGGSLNYLGTTTLGGIARDFYFPVKGELIANDDEVFETLNEIEKKASLADNDEDGYSCEEEDDEF